MPTRGEYFYQQANSSNRNFSLVVRQGSGEVGEADVISRGVRVHQQPCHMLLGGSVMRTEMHGSCTGHRGSRLAPPSARVGEMCLLRQFIVVSLPEGVLTSLALIFSV